MRRIPYFYNTMESLFQWTLELYYKGGVLSTEVNLSRLSITESAH